ncbi:sporulation integral membrane protein YtvI [Sporolactobacillus sp. THM7-7]|nr:sporulation integral membrane protein YtvI [Sporolactobacillus sp. THM7-7]
MNEQNMRPYMRYVMVFLRVFLVLIAIGGILVSLYLIVRFALPFLIACALSLFLNPVVSFLEKKTGIPRGVAAFLVLFLLFSFVISLFLFTAALLIQGVTALTRNVPEQLDALIGDLQTFFFTNLLPAWEKTIHLFSGLSDGQQKAIQLNIESMAQTLTELLSDIGSRLVASLTQFVTSLPDTLISSMFIFLAAFFLSKDSERMKTYLSALSISPSIAVPVQRVWQEMKKTCIGFVRAQFILVVLTIILVYVGLAALNVDRSFTIAVISGLVDLVPYLGTGMIFIPWILYHFFSHHYFLTIGLTSLYAAVVIQRQLLEPKVLSSNIGLDPLASLIALYFGFKWLGFAGLVLGPLSLVIMKALYQAGTLHDIWRFIIAGKANQ